MGFGEPKMPTAEEMAKMQTERALSDAELLKGGAEYVADEDGPRLDAAEAQKSDAKNEMNKEMEERELVNALKRLEIEARAGRISTNQIKNLFHPGDVVETKFQSSSYGYDTIVKIGDEIVCMKGDGMSELYKGKEIEVVGDSMGYSGKLKPGSRAHIVEIRDPREDTMIIKVRTDDGDSALLKLKQIK